MPVSLLRERLPSPIGEAGRLVATLERLGVATLGDLAGLPRPAVADRFGELGLTALDLASGADPPLRPRRPHEELIQAIGLPEAAYGTQLDRALDLLIERLIADPRRRGRSIRALRLEARLAGGGSWQAEVPMRSATTSARRITLAAGPKLEGLPAPAASLALRATELGSEAAAQPTLDGDDSERRRELLSRGGPSGAGDGRPRRAAARRRGRARLSHPRAPRDARPAYAVNAPSGFALYRPRRLEVELAAGRPAVLAGRAVSSIREEWLIEDRWWTASPLRRHYFELVTAEGRCLTVFHDLTEGAGLSSDTCAHVLRFASARARRVARLRRRWGYRSACSAAGSGAVPFARGEESPPGSGAVGDDRPLRYSMGYLSGRLPSSTPSLAAPAERET